MKITARDKAVLLQLAARLVEGEPWATVAELAGSPRQRDKTHQAVRWLYENAKIDRRNAYRGEPYEYRVNERGLALLRAAREKRERWERMTEARRQPKQEPLGLAGAPSPPKTRAPRKIRVRDLPKTDAPPARNFAEAMALARRAAEERKSQG